MASAAEMTVLRTVAGHVDMLAGDEWQLVANGDETLIDAVGADNSRVTILTFSRYAKPEEIQLVAGALDHARLMLGVIGRAAAALRGADSGSGSPPEGGRRAPKNHSAEAAMLCDSPAFWRWLMDRHGMESPASKERAAQKLRSLLGVTSRAEINDNEAVRDRWIALRRDFQHWKGRGLT